MSWGSDPRTCPAHKSAAIQPLRPRHETCLWDVAGSDTAGRRQNRRMSIAAAVVDVGWVNGLAAIRSLGRAGIRVLAVDHRPSALGFRSKYAERLLCPDPFEDEHRFVNFVRALGDVVVFPTHANVLNAIARYADDLEARTPFPSWDLLERVQSKRAQLEQAQAAGVDTPLQDPGR